MDSPSPPMDLPSPDNQVYQQMTPSPPDDPQPGTSNEAAAVPEIVHTCELGEPGTSGLEMPFENPDQALYQRSHLYSADELPSIPTLENEVEGAIAELSSFVRLIELSPELMQGPHQWFVNVSTEEGLHLTIELSERGWRIVAPSLNSASGEIGELPSEGFPTLFSLLSRVSNHLNGRFEAALHEKLLKFAD